MSTMVKFDDNIILQWINFHMKIGIQRFIIYDNKSSSNVELCKINTDAKRNTNNSSNLSVLLEDYIKKNIVILINWKYDKFKNKSGISGQTTQQNHSIWAFKNSKYIGLFDVDEYVNIQSDDNISSLLTKIIERNNIDIDNYGSFRLLNKFFYNPNNLPIDGYKFLKIYNCDNITLRRHEKNFVIPRNVNTFSIHMITSGKQMYTIKPDEVFFNHYCYLNKASRGRNKTNITDNSINKHIETL
jgi:hypothetical protein